MTNTLLGPWRELEELFGRGSCAPSLKVQAHYNPNFSTVKRRVLKFIKEIQFVHIIFENGGTGGGWTDLLPHMAGEKYLNWELLGKGLGQTRKKLEDSGWRLLRTPLFLIWLALHRQQAVPSMRHSIPKGIIIQGLLGDDICQAFPMVFDGAGLTVGLINMGLIHRAGHTSIPSMIFTKNPLQFVCISKNA